MNKAISKAVMDRARLRNMFLKIRSTENKLASNRQRNYCVSLTRKSKRNYYNNLDIGMSPITNCFGKQLNLFSLGRVLSDRNSHLLKKTIS